MTVRVFSTSFWISETTGWVFGTSRLTSGTTVSAIEIFWKHWCACSRRLDEMSEAVACVFIPNSVWNRKVSNGRTETTQDTR